jgi:hypothetical protein
MSKGRQPRIPFERACELAGGEEALKNARDPSTGKPLFSKNWRNPRSRWYNYKARGFPAYLLLPIVVARLETEQPGIEGEAVQASRDLIDLYRIVGPKSQAWIAVRALLKAALE